ncbi:DUF1963 domain-containing protein [Actinomadura adrarensis]|uniref:DUF1963 domain-containing protein n=1 Tax=Actinomadura adrarensis TaxID=1819600 RepID=A0ABW3CCC7_9ACTN
MSNDTGGAARLTTPPMPLDMGRTFPELAEMARTTVRLHPRRGTPGRGDSSMGGPLLWPRDEQWPRCAQFDQHDSFSDIDLPTDPLPLVPVLQLYASDVPELPFPQGTDLCQVLWCPLDHDDAGCAPAITVLWRDSSSITDPLLEPPPSEPDHSEEDYLPHPCVLAPERVIEYPDPLDLPWELRQRIWQWEEEAEHDWRYQYHLSTAPGTKVGGWPSWIQDPIWLTCEAGHELEHLLTIASWESDGASWKTWTPVEDRSRIRWHPSNVNGRPVQIPLVPDKEPADIMIGDAGDLYVFTCTRCEHHPVESLMQCS